MRILHLGTPFFVRDFRELGHEVIHAAFDGRGDVRLDAPPAVLKDIVSQLPNSWEPDVVLLGDDSLPPRIVGLEYLEAPLVWYAVDSHLHLSWHIQYASVFDIVLVAQRDFVGCYRTAPDRHLVEWMPAFCDARDDRRLNLSRDIPVCFVGTLNAQWNPARVALIESVRARIPLEVRTGPYVEPFNRSQIVLNQCAANDLNFRTFQAMACGAMLLSERIGNGLSELFQEGRHLAGYDRDAVDQIVEAVHRYQRQASERVAIAEAGHHAVRAAHTSRHRAERILRLLADHDLSARIIKRRRCMGSIQASLGTVYEIAWRRCIQAALRFAPDSPDFTRYRGMARRYGALAAKIRGDLTGLLERAS